MKEAAVLGEAWGDRCSPAISLLLSASSTIASVDHEPLPGLKSFYLSQVESSTALKHYFATVLPHPARDEASPRTQIAGAAYFDRVFVARAIYAPDGDNTQIMHSNRDWNEQ